AGALLAAVFVIGDRAVADRRLVAFCRRRGVLRRASHSEPDHDRRDRAGDTYETTHFPDSQISPMAEGSSGSIAASLWPSRGSAVALGALDRALDLGALLAVLHRRQLGGRLGRSIGPAPDLAVVGH